MRDGKALTLTPKLFDLLCFLVANRGRVIEKEEIFKALWPDSFVEENNLTVNIAMLRKALGERSLIETVPKRGYRFAAEVIEELPLAVVAPAVVPAAPPRSASKVRLAWAAVGVLAVALTASALYAFREPARLKAVPLPGPESNDTEPALSPDGKQLAFVRTEMGTPEIHLRILGASNVVQLTKEGTAAFAPEWSPDGKWIAFQRRNPEAAPGVNTIRIVASIGGPERSIGAMKSHSGHHKLSWTPDGEWIVAATKVENGDPFGLQAYSVRGRERRAMTRPPSTVIGDFSPAISPDGRFLAYARCITMSACQVCLQPLTNGVPAGTAIEIPSEPMYAPLIAWSADSSEIVFSGGDWAVGQLYRVPVRFHRFPGKVTPLTGAGELGAWPSIALVGRTNLQRMVYTRDNFDRNLWKLDLKTGAKSVIAATRRIEQCPRISPRGDRIAFASTRSGTWEIWNCDATGNHCTQVTDFGRGLCLWVNWSPDGRMLVFDSRRDGQPDIFVVNGEGGPARQLTSSAFAEVAPVWSKDGKWIYYASNRTGRYEIWKIAPEGGQEIQVTRDGAQMPQLSADGRWLYFMRYGESGLWRMALEAGRPERVAGAENASGIHAYKVTAKAVFFVAQDVTWHMRRLDLATGELKSVMTTTKDPVMGLDVDAAETSLIYGWNDREEHELMVVENFR